MVGTLYKSLFCRLCGECNKNGIPLYDDKLKLCSIVNKYLPIKVTDDGIYPTTICPGCRIHLEDTSFFIETILKGQLKLKELRKEENGCAEILPNADSFSPTINLYNNSPRKDLAIIDNDLSHDNIFYSKEINLIDEQKTLLYETEALISHEENVVWVEDFLVDPNKSSESSSKDAEQLETNLQNKPLMLSTVQSFEHAVSEVLVKDSFVTKTLDSNVHVMSGNEPTFVETLIENESIVQEESHSSTNNMSSSKTQDSLVNDSHTVRTVCAPRLSAGLSVLVDTSVVKSAQTHAVINGELVITDHINSIIVNTDPASSVMVKRKRGRPRKVIPPAETIIERNKCDDIINEAVKASAINSDPRSLKSLDSSADVLNTISLESVGLISPKEASLNFTQMLPTANSSLETTNSPHLKTDLVNLSSSNAYLLSSGSDIQVHSDSKNSEPSNIVASNFSIGSDGSSKNDVNENPNNIEPVKRRRGRPTKEESKLLQKSTPASHAELAGPRIRKPPARFSELVEGKELDKALKDIGAINEEDIPQQKMQNPDGTPIQSVESCGKFGRLLSADERLLGYLSTLIKNSVMKTVFTCDGCESHFPRFSQFLAHKSEGLCGLFECFRCKAVLSSCEEKESHEGNCQAETTLKWICSSCNESFQTLADLQHHTTLAHPLQKCLYCKKKFLLRRNLESHVFKIHPKKKIMFKCQHCDKEYSNFPSLLYHEERGHHNYLYQCIKCEKLFNHRQLVTKHQVVHHDVQVCGMKDDRFPCNLCNRTLKSSVTLRAHLKIHETGRNFFCDICLAAFKYKKSLLIHMKGHTGEKPFQCSFCPKAFKQKGNLVEHVRIHSGERPHQCSECQSAFKTSSQLRCHFMTHSAHKPYSCTLCLKRFLKKEALEIHSRRHKGERPFSCAVCTKAFVELHALKKHLRTHSGERPFTCRVCDRTFSDCSNLSKHMKNVHKQQLNAPSVAATADTLYLDLNQISADQLTDLRLDDLDSGVNEQGDTLCLAISTSHPQLQEMKELNVLEDSTRKIVTDELGVPLKVTLADGSQLQVTTMDGESLQVVTNDGVQIPVKLNVESLDNLTTLESLNVDVNNSLTDLTNIGDDYGIHFITDEGQDIRILPGSFSVSNFEMGSSTLIDLN